MSKLLLALALIPGFASANTCFLASLAKQRIDTAESAFSQLVRERERDQQDLQRCPKCKGLIDIKEAARQRQEELLNKMITEGTSELETLNPKCQAEKDQQEAEVQAARAAAAALAAKPGARIGMTMKQVLNGTNWGKPDKINRTITAKTVTEQWVYENGYLYFTNGFLTAIQN